MVKHLLQFPATDIVAQAHVEVKVHQLAPRREEKVVLSSFPPSLAPFLPLSVAQQSSQMAYVIKDPTSNLISQALEGYPNF